MKKSYWFLAAVGLLMSACSVFNDQSEKAKMPQLLFMGNSTLLPVYELFIADQEPFECYNLATYGHKINDQLNSWNALSANQKTQFDYILVQIGLNDLDSNLFVSDYQNLINTIRNEKRESCIIVGATLTPAKAFVNYDHWLELNNAIKGNGPVNIIGIDYVLTTNTTVLDADSDGYLDNEYDSGDGLHPNREGTKRIKENYLGFLRLMKDQ